LSPVETKPGLAGVGEPAAVETALVGGVGIERRVQIHLATDANIDLALQAAEVGMDEFATYLPTEKRWRINLEYLRCNGLGEYRRGNQCLDVDFVAVGSHFHLARKSYAECGY
jgi:hypothetical protein